MDVVVQIQSDKDLSLEIGNFEDLEALVGLLNQTWEAVEYRLQPVSGQEDLYMFIEDFLNSDEYECGVVEKRGAKAYAFSAAVHGMIMGAYHRYLEETQ